MYQSVIQSNVLIIFMYFNEFLASADTCFSVVLCLMFKSRVRLLPRVESRVTRNRPADRNDSKTSQPRQTPPFQINIYTSHNNNNNNQSLPLIMVCYIKHTLNVASSPIS